MRRALTCITGSAMIAVSASLSSIPAAFAQSDANAILVLRPHCILENRLTCPTFDVADAEHTQTAQMRPGDILDIDIILVSLKPEEVSTVRSWLKYDPNQLEARSIELTPASLPQPIPDEQSIDQAQGIIKIGGGTNGKLTSKEAVVARVTLRILGSTTMPVLAFHNFKPDGSGETSVTHEAGGKMTSLMLAKPSALNIRVAGTQTTVTGTASSQAVMQTQASQSSAAASAFSLLQVQNLRVTSKDRTLFVGWQPLTSAETAGYNVYYGTISGRYIQRRSLEKQNTSLVLRDLEPNTTYFVAVRAYNQANAESAFSHEVAVVVGKPEPSTAPLLEGTQQTPAPQGNLLQQQNGSEISGQTGIGSSLLGLFIVSALIGTGLAYRRQFSLPSLHGN